MASSITRFTEASAVLIRRRAGVGNQNGALTGRSARVVFQVSSRRIEGPN